MNNHVVIGPGIACQRTSKTLRHCLSQRNFILPFEPHYYGPTSRRYTFLITTFSGQSGLPISFAAELRRSAARCQSHGQWCCLANYSREQTHALISVPSPICNSARLRSFTLNNLHWNFRMDDTKMFKNRMEYIFK